MKNLKIMKKFAKLRLIHQIIEDSKNNEDVPKNDRPN